MKRRLASAVLKAVWVFVLFCLTLPSLKSQHYWIYFTDKDGVQFDPESYFAPEALERRLRTGIPLHSLSDYPVKHDYVEKVTGIADSTGFVSRWFNAVAVVASSDQIEMIAALPFVSKVESSHADLPRVYASAPYDTTMIFSNMIVEDQVRTLGLTHWRNAGIDGNGVRIAVFDGGFPTYRDNPVFRHLNEQNRILHTWDFTRNREDVNRGIAHGTMVLSCIGGMVGGKQLGLATGASYMLAITEVRTEPFREEQNWLAAAEWADKHGADIINSSLGYTYHRYFNHQMDGKSTLVTRAANMAAAKGILVVNAAGNDGSDKWKIVGAPADGDSVLSVGGVDPFLLTHTSFSSFGPTFDRRMKPNVVAFGHVIAAGKKGLTNTQGTSFASPLVAGFAACAWQTDRSVTNMELFRKIEQSGHLYPYFDYAHGFGIPRATGFLDSTSAIGIEPTFTLEINFDDSFSFSTDEVGIDEDGGILDQYMYLHIRDAGGVLSYYAVYLIDDVTARFSDLNMKLSPGETACVHYRGHYECISLE
ncbi:MAG: S8 family serine peptidase [Bacteroidales bacterium]